MSRASTGLVLIRYHFDYESAQIWRLEALDTSSFCLFFESCDVRLAVEPMR
jgi:hypothetical protein